MSPTPAPRRAPAEARPAPAPAVSRWSVANPVDDDLEDDPHPPAPAPRARPATKNPRPAAAAGQPVRPAGTNRPRAPRPASGGATSVIGAPRTAETGKPRVDWRTYDAQVYDSPPEWVLYRCWTRVPLDRRWYVRLLARVLIFLIGRRHGLLWIGISVRAGIARATEHLADKPWRRLIHVFEIDPDAGDAGPPGARYFTTEKAAEAYETARIKAERPMKNTRDNDRAYNPNATHLTKRIKAHHLADWHQQAGQLAIAWLAAAALCTWWLWPETMPAGFTARADAVFGALVAGVAAGACVLMFARILRLAIIGAQPTTAQRRRIVTRGRS